MRRDWCCRDMGVREEKRAFETGAEKAENLKVETREIEDVRKRGKPRILVVFDEF